MNCLVVGHGSIGSRHARLLGELGHEVSVVSSRDTGALKRYLDLASALDALDWDYVVIASPTVNHAADLALVLRSGHSGIVLVEKPLFAFPAQRGLMEGLDTSRVLVGYNLRFHPVLRELKSCLQGRTVHSMHIYCGQHLSQWRPGRDLRATYSASAAAGGGVLRDLSHELDAALWLGGSCIGVLAHGGTFGTLGVDSDDLFGLLMRSERCPLTTLQINYLDRKARRQYLVNAEDSSFSGDLITSILEQDGEETQFASHRDQTFLAQHEAIAAGNMAEMCDYEQGLAVVRLIEAAELAARERREVAP